MDALVIEKLEKLGSLLEKGILTREEFDAQKGMLLAPQAPPAPVAAAPPTAPTPAPAVVQAAPPPTPPAAPVVAPAPEPQPVAPTPAVLPKPREPTSPVTLALAAVLGGLLLLFIGVPVVNVLSDGPARQTAQAAPAYEEPAAPAKKAPKKRPVFTGTVTACDTSCAGLFSDCVYIACSISNTGKAEGLASVTFSAGSVQSTSAAYLMPGESSNVSAKLQGAEEGMPCYCTVEDDSESIGE